jgi:hypothetical protein
MVEDYAILGGGFSGLYILSILPSKYKVTLYEKTSRLGGRIYTVDNIDYGAARIRPKDVYIADRLNIPTIRIDDYPSNNFTVIDGKVRYYGDIREWLRIITNRCKSYQYIGSFRDIMGSWYDVIWRVTGYDLFRNDNIAPIVQVNECIDTSDYHYYPIGGMYNIIDRLVESSRHHRIYLQYTDIHIPARNVVITYPPTDTTIWYPWRAIKIALRFNRYWWTDINIEYGKCTSDGMIRQIWYLPSGMVIYCDDITADRWRQILPSDASDWVKARDQEYIRIISNEISKMFNIDDPSISEVSWKYWRYGCGLWRRDIDIQSIISNIRKSKTMYISDCYNLHPGWIGDIIEDIHSRFI